jgi:hypothetical protein
MSYCKHRGMSVFAYVGTEKIRSELIVKITQKKKCSLFIKHHPLCSFKEVFNTITTHANHWNKVYLFLSVVVVDDWGIGT